MASVDHLRQSFLLGKSFHCNPWVISNSYKKKLHQQSVGLS